MPNIVQDAYKTALLLMDEEGMLPQHNCKRCGKPLNADGGHPAELYLGTYTGFCYQCERSGVWVLEIHADGARRLSYPPDCPSHRRDRREFWAYQDCIDCKGAGHHYVHQDLRWGGGYLSYCETCFTRFYANPLRKLYDEAYHLAFDACQRAFEAAVREKYGIPKKFKTFGNPLERPRKNHYCMTDNQVKECYPIALACRDINHVLVEIARRELWDSLIVKQAEFGIDEADL